MDHAETRLGCLAPLVGRCVGYRYEGFEPGIHRGLPSPTVTLVISLGTPLALKPPEVDRVEAHQALVGGLHTKPAVIVHDGNQYGIQLDLPPHAIRSLFAIPAAELATQVVPLSDVLPAADELIERLAAAPNWDERFAIVESTLRSSAAATDAMPSDMEEVWSEITRARGNIRIRDVAAELGWSRRHLSERFRREYGLTPKDVARLSRFTRAIRLIHQPIRPTFAELAAACGYVDQSHLTRDWVEFAGCTPTQWLATEVLPFVQDEDAVPAGVFGYEDI